ncbi:MAG TPA: hypothetical protein VKT18_02070, partial [Acidimicrobiales bacterium]|nr:hypothetical protein [Acidimicrobiales bacterium]
MRLPPHFIPRPRLTRRCEHAQVVVVEAAAGCGKSVLGLELAAHWGSVPVVVLLERAEVSAPLLVARTRAAVKAAVYTDAAAAAAEAGEDAVGALDAMLTALAGEQCTFLIDDAHEASADAAALLERFASNLSGHQHLVVLCRRLPEGASRLERAVHVALDGADLCLTADETLEVCRRGFHVDVPTDAAGLLHEATGGWTAAVVLTASRAARTGAPLDARSHVASPASHGDVVARILDDTLQSIGGDAPAAFAQVGRLPLVSADLVDELTGCRGLFALALDRGMPFTPSRDQWWELPNVVRERLAAVAPADPDALRHAAEVYAACGETRAALELLLGAGEFHACAAVLAGAPRVTELMDVAELEAIVDVLPASAIEAHPLVLLHLSRSLRVATRFEDANALLDRVRGLAATPQSEELDRAVRAEHAHDLMIRLQPSDAQVVAREVLATASSDEVLTRARASAALGMALCWQLDESGRRRDERALDEASASFERATRLFHQLSMPAAAAAVVPYWAVSIEFARGRARTALEMLDAALAEGVGSPRRWAYVQTFRALVAADLGLDDVCADAIDDTLRVAAQLQSDLLFALGYWRLAILSSYRGDAETTLASVRQVEAHRGTWWAPGSGDFLAEAADCLDRVGLVEIAREYLERVQAEPKDVAHLVAMAAAAVEARHGDPDVAVSLLADVAESRIDTRERWRVTLLEAYARFRGGRHGEAGVLAARAFEQAAALGQPRLPLVKEPGVTAELLGLAVETGQPASLALHDVSLPRRLALLGRVELRCGGRLVPLAAGQERQLLT